MVKRRYKARRAIKSIIFDLDGTLTVFKIDYIAARREIINKLYAFGIPKGLVSIKQRIMEAINIVENYLKTNMRAPEKIQLIKDQIERIVTKYELDGALKTDLIPGAMNLLKTLKSKNYKLGLFTLENREVTKFILERFSIGSFFNSIVTRNDVSNPKPHPDHLKMVLTQLNVLPNEIIVVGDNPIDIECAKQINAIAIARLSDRHENDELLKAGADFVVENLLEINDILKELL